MTAISSNVKRLYHVTIGTLNSWLPGDPRGFRSRDHRIHSSGDHRNPPLPGEHANLHRYAQDHSGRAVLIPSHLRRSIGLIFNERMQLLGHSIYVTSVSGMHVHLLAELPVDKVAADQDVGRIKRVASLRVNRWIPGRLWERDMGRKPIRDMQHQIEVYNYILDHQNEGAWVWSHISGEMGPLKR